MAAVQRLLKRYKRRHEQTGVRELVNQVDASGESPLLAACKHNHSRLVPILLQAGADARRATATDETPLHIAAANNYTDVLVELLVRDESAGTVGGDLFFPPTNDGTSVMTVLPRRFADVGATTANGETPLFVAAKHGHKDVVSELLSCHARTEIANEDGWTPLHVVANNNHVSVVIELLAQGADVNAVDEGGSTPLHIAATHGHKDVASELLARGADVDAVDDDNETPLFVASRRGHKDVVSALLEHEANAEIPATTSATPLHIAANNNHIDVVSALLAHGANANAGMADGATSLHVAAHKDLVEIAIELLKRSADVNAATADGTTPLSVAAFKGHIAVATVLLAHNADVDLATATGETPLFIAANNNHNNVVIELLKHNANVDLGTKTGTTPLYIAASSGHCDIVTELLKYSENVDRAAETGATPLFVAALHGHSDVVSELLAHNADANAATAVGATPLHAAAQQGNKGTVVALLARGASVNAAGPGGLTPLFVAVQKGHVDIVSALLKHNADVNVTGEDGVTALHRAAQSGYTDIALALLASHASVNAVKASGTTPLHTAAFEGRTDTVIALLAHGAAVEAATSTGLTALLMATHFGHIDVVTALLKRNANADAAKATGETALHIAAANGRTDIVTQLLAWHAHVDSASATGETPLYIAAKHGHKDVVLELLAHSADIEAVPITGETALHIAALNGRLDVVTELLAHNADVEATNADGQTALHGATKIGHADVVRALLVGQASVDATAQDAWTSLHIAARSGRSDIVRALLAHAANVNAITADGWTPLFIAANNGHKDVVAALLAPNANVDAAAKDRTTPLYIAAKYGYNDVVSELLAHGANADATTVKGWTPMLAAAQNGHNDTVFELLAHGANADAVTIDGVSVLHLAVHFGHTDLTAALLARTIACIESTASTGWTPLHLAAASGNLDDVRLLVHRGKSASSPVSNSAQEPQTEPSGLDDNARSSSTSAMLEIADNDGDTPVLAAARAGHFHVVRFLLEAGASAIACARNGETLLMIAAQGRHQRVVSELLWHDSRSNHASLVAVTLETLRADAQDVYEFKEMWTHVVEHLHNVYKRIVAAPRDAARASAVLPLAMLVCHVVRLKTVCSAANVFARIAASPTAANRFRDVHTELAFLEQDGTGPTGVATTSTDWAAQSTREETALLKRFQDTIEAAAAFGARDDAAFVKAPGDAILLLRHKVHTQGHTCSPALLQLLGECLGITTRAIAGTPATSLTEWFIPPHELDLARVTSSTKRQQTLPATALVRGEWASAAVVASEHTQIQRETFVQCIETCVGLSHPNAVKVYGASHLRLPLVAVCEDARSTSLRSYLEQDATKSLIWQKLMEVARGLQYLAERGVVVETLRCDDIWIGTDGLAKVNVFSCLALDDMDAETRAKATMQRVQWRAPECVRGAAATTASTVFSLGICMVEALTGEQPWKSAGPDFVAYMTKYGSRPPIPDAMPAIAQVLLTQLWLEDPQRRPTLASVALELKRIAEAQQQSTRSRSNGGQASHVRFDLSADIVPELGASVRTFVERLGHKCARCALDQRSAATYILARCQSVLALLQTQYLVWDTVALTTFCDVLQRFDRFLRFALSDKPVLQLAKSQRSNVFHHQLDEVVSLLGLASVDSIHDWQSRQADSSESETQDECSGDVSPALGPLAAAKTDTNAVTIVRFANAQLNERFQELDFAAIDAVATGQRDAQDALARLPWFIHSHDLKITGDAIGTGAFGEVYRAMWLNTPVVVKFMGYEADKNAYSRELFFHELRVWYPLRHPHVAKLYGACHVGKRFFACELVGGGTLDAYLKKQPNRCWTLLHQVGLGLQYLHDQNVLHNDLKCDNVLIGADDGYAKLIDFGLSSILESAEIQVALKRQGATHWRSPEYLRGERLTLASDIYAFAMLILEAVTGEPPWGRTAIDAFVKFRVVKKGMFPSQPASVTATQWALIRTMGAPVPAQRVQIAFVVDRLREFAQQEQEQQQQS